jgi:hypothetical protein
VHNSGTGNDRITYINVLSDALLKLWMQCAVRIMAFALIVYKVELYFNLTTSQRAAAEATLLRQARLQEILLQEQLLMQCHSANVPTVR